VREDSQHNSVRTEDEGVGARLGGGGALLPVEREDLCAEDADEGLEVLRWSREHACPSDEDTVHSPLGTGAPGDVGEGVRMPVECGRGRLMKGG
jgi:hypothetical protein